MNTKEIDQEMLKIKKSYNGEPLSMETFSKIKASFMQYADELKNKGVICSQHKINIQVTRTGQTTIHIDTKDIYNAYDCKLNRNQQCKR